MMARTCISRSWKSLIAAMAVFLLLFALPGGAAYAAETVSAGGLVTASAVEASGGDVTDGESFVAALGGQATYAVEDGVCVVTLNGDVELQDVALLNAGSYKLIGEGTISRAEGYKGLLLKVVEGVSLEIAGKVVLDGGAVWTKDGEPSESAVGATNSGIVAIASLMDNIRGNVVVSENAVLRNNDSFAAIYAERGTTTMKGGAIYGNRATSNYGGGIHSNYGTVDLSGGEIWGNVGGPNASASAIYGYSTSTVKVSGGSVHDNAGPVAVSGYSLTVSGGEFSNNLGAALGRCSGSAHISGGKFSGNADGAFANSLTSSVRLQMSGSPQFVTEADAKITSMVTLVGDLGDDVAVRLVVNEYRMGNQVLFGTPELLEANHSHFAMAGDDEGLVVNAEGRIDTNPSSFVHNGADLVQLFGGEEVATSSYDEETGVYTITLSGDVALPRMTYIESGSYVLTGTGTITRSGSYPGALLKNITGTSLEITGSIVIDGGAVWTKDGELTESAVGARNTGVVSNMALVDNYGGRLKISGDVILRNNSNNCAVYCDNGTLEITGGQIYGIGSTDGGGAVRIYNNSTATIKGGEFWGNATTSNGRGSGVDGENSTVKIEGGTFRDNSGPAVAAARNLEVTGGTFKDNAGAALGTRGSNSVTLLSGGTFEGNAGGVYACTYGTSALRLSGSPSFATDTDATVHSTVQLVGELGENVSVRIQPNSFTLGDTVITGSEDLLAAHIGQFTLVSDSGEYVINADGRVDTSTTSLITNGDDFAAALGGMGFATSTLDEETGIYTIELTGNVVLPHQITIEAGSYVLTGSGSITRGGNYQGVIIKNSAGASLEISGSVVIDGGAVWTKGGEPTESAVGATNSGIVSTMALVDNIGGTLKISGDAILRNNSMKCAVYCDNGTLEITGGQIYGNNSNDGGGAVRIYNNSTATIKGGEFWGNSLVSNGRGSGVDGENSTVKIEGGTFRDNSGPAVVAARNLEVAGGTFKDNAGAALGTRASNSVTLLSGGTFEGNAGGVYACTNGTAALKLSGSPSFATDADATVHSTVELVGELGDRVMMRIHLNSYEQGQRVLTGDAALVAAYHSRFSLVGADGEYVVSASGEVDTNPAISVSDGESFAAALGGEGFATSSRDEETGIYTIALSSDVVMSRAIEVTSGSYVLEGQGVISRANGYTAALFSVASGASLEISGEVVLDGGAKWMKDGEQVSSAVGATNDGAKSVMALVNSYGGDVVLSGKAALRNNDGNPALYANQGTLRIAGGSIYGNSRSGYGAAVDFSNATFAMTDGTIWGNVGEGLGSVIRGDTSDATVQISGGTVSDNAGSIAIAGASVSVSGGAFSGNSGTVLGVDESGTALVSGGVFDGNAGGVFSNGGSSVPLQLSGSPDFKGGDNATVYATVQLVDALGDDVAAKIKLDSYLVGDQVLLGDEALVQAYYSRFTLVSENDEFIVNSAGKVDTDPTSFVTNGDAFAAALGGEGVAASSYDKATDTYTVTLKGDVALTHAIVLESGSYVLTGSGTISRGGSYTNALLKIGEGASLKITGEVILDGGAIWMKNGEQVASAIEAEDRKGVMASWPMIENAGGVFTLSGNAVLRNNYEYPALYSLGGTITIEGGSIYGNGSDFGAVFFTDATLVMTDGDIWGNWGDGILYGYNYDSSVDYFSGSIEVSGGSLHDNGCDAVLLADQVTVTGGTFSNNEDFAVGGRSVAISGGTFSGNYGAVYAFDREEPGVVKLSGAPVFEGEYDVIIGIVEVAGPLTGSDVPVLPLFIGDEDNVVIRGADSYTLTESDVAKFSLFGEVTPEGWYLDFDSENNQIVIVQAAPILLEASAVGDIEFDGAAVEPGADFNVKVFQYVDGVKGDDITANYEVGGGSVPVTYRYREEGSVAFKAGLPSDPGTYEVQAVAAADKVNGFASGTAQFKLSIIGGFAVTFYDGQGNVIAIDWVVSGGAAQAPTDPVREGYVFKGWDVDFSNVTSNLDVTALWEQESVSSVIALINALPAPGDVTVADEAAIAAAQAAYDALSPEAKALVDVACGTKLKDVAAALQAAKDAAAADENAAPAKAKAANPMVVKAKKAVKVKASKLQKKAQKIARAKAIAVSGAKGKVTYKLKGVKKAKFKKYFKVAKKSGKIKVKKGLKKGTYRLKIAVTAAGDASYEAATKVVTVKVKVK